ncbi:MAG TPA: hypothetical protein PLA90_12460 [Candidatus Sumerlaeota bacterium]|nr:hypothetical protein [Candidatus Sumerlaeota bacterium]
MNAYNLGQPEGWNIQKTWINRYLPFLAISLTCLILHGLIFLNERPFWDGLIILHLLKTRNWPDLYRWFSEAGLPSFACFYWGIGAWTSNPVLAYRATTFLSLLLNSLAFYGACRFFTLPKTTATLLAILALAYPVHASEEMILTPYHVFISFFYLSVLLSLYGKNSDGLRRKAIRLISLAGFFLSFSAESLLAFYAGFLGLFFVYILRKETIGKEKTIVRSLLTIASRHLDYLVLPFLYFTLKHIFFHPYGNFSDYNKIRLDFQPFISSYWGFLKNAFFFPINSAISFYGPLEVMVVLTLLSFFYDRISPTAPSGRPLGRIGIILWILGVTAYVLAQKSPSILGISTRFEILLGVPTSLLLLGLLQFWVPDSRCRGILYLFLIAAFTFITWKNHLDWQGRTVKDLALVRCLKRTPPPTDYSTFFIDDTMPLFCERNGKIYKIYDHTVPYEWGLLFRDVSNDKVRIGVSEKNDQEFQTYLKDWLACQQTFRFGFSKWQYNGKVCRMKIIYGAPEWGQSGRIKEWDPCNIGLKFLALKLTRPLERQNEFLDNLLRIEYRDMDTQKILP